VCISKAPVKCGENRDCLVWEPSQPSLVTTSVCLSVVTSLSQGKEVVRDLGVYLDSKLSLKQHITTVANSCFHHLRRLHQIRRSIEKDVMVQLVVAFVLSRIDYCCCRRLNCRCPRCLTVCVAAVISGVCVVCFLQDDRPQWVRAEHGQQMIFSKFRT